MTAAKDWSEMMAMSASPLELAYATNTELQPPEALPLDHQGCYECGKTNGSDGKQPVTGMLHHHQVEGQDDGSSSHHTGCTHQHRHDRESGE